MFCTPALSQVVEDHRGEVLLPLCFLTSNGPVHILIGSGKYPVGREAFHREGAADTDDFLVFIGLVVERFGIGVAGDGGVDLLCESSPL